MFLDLCRRIEQLASPAVVAISGFGGAGKSTLAARLANRLGATVISSDDFSIGQQGKRCDDWSSIDRARLREALETGRYQAYDWPNDRLGDWRDIGSPRVLIVEGIGIIHPDLRFDLTVWVDVPLEVASERGRYRDKEIYEVDHDALWRDLWTPNDRDYFARFHPRDRADVVYAQPPNEHEVAVVVLRDADGAFFIHQRRADKRVYPNKWGVGAGGKLDYGEPVASAAARELKEETGVVAEPVHLFDEVYEDAEMLSHMHVFEAVVERDAVGFDETEWCEARWVTRDELLGFDLCPDTRLFVSRYLALKTNFPP